MEIGDEEYLRSRNLELELLLLLLLQLHNYSTAYCCLLYQVSNTRLNLRTDFKLTVSFRTGGYDNNRWGAGLLYFVSSTQRL